MSDSSRPAADSAATAVTAGPGRSPAAAKTGDSAETTLRLTEDRDRIASEINDVVIRRLFAAGLVLQGAMGLLDGHRAATSIRDAIAELDQAISDLRDSVFGARPTRSPRGGWS
jgi:signal transduction histidine kinase